MPITKSAKKALRVSLRRKGINLKWKNQIKELLKKSRKAIAKKDKKAAELVAQTAKVLDKAAKKNIIHKNKASRLKSRLMIGLNKTWGKEVKLPKVTVAQEATEKPKNKRTKEQTLKRELKTSKTKSKTTKTIKSTKKSA